MSKDFTPITDIDALDRLLGDTAREPIILFKHDTMCPISAAAFRELSQMGGDVALIDVERHKDVAQELAARTGIAHESPQVIVWNRGRARWSASLYDITHDAVARAMRQG
jgi:bacillithiol system protein YtxJ